STVRYREVPLHETDLVVGPPDLSVDNAVPGVDLVVGSRHRGGERAVPEGVDLDYQAVGRPEVVDRDLVLVVGFVDPSAYGVGLVELPVAVLLDLTARRGNRVEDVLILLDLLRLDLQVVLQTLQLDIGVGQC